MVDIGLTLPTDHPGVHDQHYRLRRARIAETGAAYRAGDPLPDVVYTPEEDEVWRTVSAELTRLHAEYACADVQDAGARLHLPTERVPQLREVDAATTALTGFRFRPVPGLVPIRDFYGLLADRVFLSTQYVRHHTVPFYTPEPDVIHEIIGHATTLASPQLASLYEAAGHASRRTQREDALEFLSRVFWFTIEFGVVWEQGALRTYGAGLLSSYGEIQAFREAEVRPWNLAEMGTLDYDITHYQPVLFAAADFPTMCRDLSTFLLRFDDSTYLREFR